jgi:hypothetical protein
VRLDVYRSCSRQEKRAVLEAYWRRDVQAPARITDAAVQYGPWAVLCCAILVLEPIPVLALSASHAPVVLGLFGLLEVLLVTSLWWSAVRLAAVRRLVAA